MGIVDFGKRLHSKSTEFLLPEKFVFHHVPKCGGTSVGRALRKRYLLSQATVSPESSYRAFELMTERSDREKMLVDVLDLREQMLMYHMFEGIRGISLHVRFSQKAYHRFSEDYKFITIMREPIARFISHYNWSFCKSGAHASIDDEFDVFLYSDRAARLGATYSEYFSGLSKNEDIRSAEAVEAAIGNLTKFAVIGDLRNLKKFESQIRDVLGIRVAIKHENKAAEGRRMVEAGYLRPEQLDRIELLCAPDKKIYNAVVGMPNE